MHVVFVAQVSEPETAEADEEVVTEAMMNRDVTAMVETAEIAEVVVRLDDAGAVALAEEVEVMITTTIMRAIKAATTAAGDMAADADVPTRIVRREAASSRCHSSRCGTRRNILVIVDFTGTGERACTATSRLTTRSS